MHDIIKLGYIGLGDRDLRVLSSIFTLSPELKSNYLLIDSSEVAEADLVLVNIDDATAVKGWNKIHNINPLAVPITVSATGKTIQGTVSLSLPIRVQMLIAALAECIEDRSIIKGNKSKDQNTDDLSILIVDDSYPVRKYMEQKLIELIDVPLYLGFANSGEEAMAKIRKRHYDLVFLDVMMEGVDGYKVCKAIRASKSTYICMLTSKKSPFDKVRGTMSGCDAYVTKPPSDENLVREVERSIQLRNRMQEQGARQLNG